MKTLVVLEIEHMTQSMFHITNEAFVKHWLKKDVKLVLAERVDVDTKDNRVYWTKCKIDNDIDFEDVEDYELVIVAKNRVKKLTRTLDDRIVFYTDNPVNRNRNTHTVVKDANVYAAYNPVNYMRLIGKIVTDYPELATKPNILITLAKSNSDSLTNLYQSSLVFLDRMSGKGLTTKVIQGVTKTSRLLVENLTTDQDIEEAVKSLAKKISNYKTYETILEHNHQLAKLGYYYYHPVGIAIFLTDLINELGKNVEGALIIDADKITTGESTVRDLLRYAGGVVTAFVTEANVIIQPTTKQNKAVVKLAESYFKHKTIQIDKAK